jgi:RHS repeat-associated protein
MNLFYSRDHLGSVREVTDANGNLVARYDYDAWGRRTRVFGTYRADWGYAGYFVHRASKLNLTWYRAYDPDLGRWVSRDPIGEAGGMNFYAYVENNPINFTDPYGLIHVARDGRLHDDAKGGLETLCNNKATRARDISWLQRSIAVRSLENQNFLDAFNAVQAGKAEWLPGKKPYDFWRNYDGHERRIEEEIATLNRCRARDDDDKCEQTERIMDYYEKRWLEEAFKEMMRSNRQRGAPPLPLPFPVPFRIPIPFRR